MPRPSSGAEDRRGIVASPEIRELIWQEGPMRLDRALRRIEGSWGRSVVSSLIADRRVRINSRVVWMSSWQVERGDRLEIAVPTPADLPPFDALDSTWIVADDGDIVVIDKPSGLRSEAVRTTDMTPNLLSLARNALDDALVLAHRLDRDTSGLVVLTRPGPVRAELDQMFRTHTIVKHYVAVVADLPDLLGDRGQMVDFLAPDPRRRDMVVTVAKGGRKAVTDYTVIARADGLARVALVPRTGRTHQLRVQLATRGAPILGDRLYGDASAAPRLLLHANTLDVPATAMTASRRFDAPAPF